MNVSVRVQNRRVTLDQASWSPGLGQVVALLAAATLAALIYAFTSVRALDLSYQVSSALATQKELREAGRRLQVELSHLRSPERLENEGRRLGLYPPTPEQTRVLR